MPGPAFGLVAEFKDYRIANVAEYHGHQYMTMHLRCANGAQCTGQGCRANTGKTRVKRHGR